MHLTEYFVLTRSTRSNPQGVTTPEEAKAGNDEALARAKLEKERLNDEHSNAQDHNLSNEQNALDDLVNAEENIGILERIANALSNLL